MSSKPIQHPLIFTRYDVSEIARRTRYSEGHVVNVKRGTVPASSRFRRACALAFAESEEVLFGHPTPT